MPPKNKRERKPAAPQIALLDRFRQWLAAHWLEVLCAVCTITGYNLREVIQSEPRQAQREHVGKDTIIASATHSNVNATEAHVNSRLDLRLPPL